MYKLRKNKNQLLAKWKLKIGKKHYFHIFLWEDQENFEANTIGNTPGKVAACVHFAPTIVEVLLGDPYSETTSPNEIKYSAFEKEIVRPKLGEAHFIKDKWDLEVVAHELCHILLHRLRVLEPSVEKIMEQEYDSEETVCYAFGRWANQIYSMLWEVNPYGKYSKKENPNECTNF